MSKKVKKYGTGAKITIKWDNGTIDAEVLGQFEEHVTVKIGKIVITVYPQEIIDNKKPKR